MKFTHTKIVLAVLFLIAFQLTAAWAKPADSNDANTTAIKKLFTDFNDAFNSHDAHAEAAYFTDDADYITIGGATVKGSAAIEQHLVPLFNGALKNTHRDATLRGIRFLRPDIATVDSDFVASGLVSRDGASMPNAKGIYDWIVMKQPNGRWLIAVWHESYLPAPPAGAGR